MRLIIVINIFIFVMSEACWLVYFQDEETVDELDRIPKDLWLKKKLDDCNFWFLKSLGMNRVITEYLEIILKLPG